MVRTRLYFWGSALGVAVLFAGLLALVFSTGPIDMDTINERERGWLLSLWTTGVMAICFGGVGLLGGISGMSFKDVAEAGSLTAAIAARREIRGREGDSAFYNFAGWTVSTGALLILLYFAGWLFTGR